MSAEIGSVVEHAEAIHKARVITFEPCRDNPKKRIAPGGMCSCCGASPRVDGADDWWLVFKAGLCDSDGVFYSMLCGGPSGEGCLEEVRAENAKRKRSPRDDMASMSRMLNGDDVDGMDADMDDMEFLGLLDE
jgi:hypothetical protein